MIKNIVSECSKLAQKKYKIRHDWIEKVIYWELYKKLKSDDAIKLYFHNPKSVLDNEMCEVLCDFKIKTDHQISATRLNLVIVTKKEKKEKLPNRGLCRASRPQSKIKRKRKER